MTTRRTIANVDRAQGSTKGKEEGEDQANPVDRDAHTPRVSGSFSAFHDAARGLAESLASSTSPLAAALREKAVELANVFATWPENPPDVEARSATIQALVDLNGQVHAFLNRER